MTDATNPWSAWVGREEEAHDTVAPGPMQRLAATLDRAADTCADMLHPLGHWLHFLPAAAQSQLGEDGHPRRGGFLPPVPLPRRMWAGSRIVFHSPLVMGAAIRRVSRIEAVDSKSGRSGQLVFVRVAHEILGGDGLAIREEQDIVYRDQPAPGAAVAQAPVAPSDAQFTRDISPDPVLLFRYSALTFNGHRIHYDRPYATGSEHYPGLVVHGPLIATLLLDALMHAHPGVRIASYEFKAVSPLFDTAPFAVCGRVDGDVARLWARTADGRLAMQAQARVA